MSKNRLSVGGKDYVIGTKKKHVDYAKQERESKMATRRKEELHRAGVIYQRFKTALLATPTKPEELAGRFLALRDKLSSEIKSRRIRALVLGMVDQTIEKARAVYGIPVPPPMKEGGEK